MRDRSPDKGPGRKRGGLTAGVPRRQAEAREVGWGWGGTGQEIRRIYTRGGPKNCPRTGQVCYYDCYTHRRDNAKVSKVLVRRERKNLLHAVENFFIRGDISSQEREREFLFGKNVSIKDGMDREGGGEKHHRGKWESHQIRDGETKILLLLFSLSSHVRLFSFTFFGGKNERE